MSRPTVFRKHLSTGIGETGRRPLRVPLATRAHDRQGRKNRPRDARELRLRVAERRVIDLRGAVWRVQYRLLSAAPGVLIRPHRVGS